MSRHHPNVPQAIRHSHRPPLRQMRRQMPGLRFLRQAHNPRSDMRRVFIRKLPE
ncbi:uncharacterized protein H6S33_007809 [Morchella sextelata]|uniref:uncharacterized protein n=1 Tax=Morchella sextelata TaxID=1174677 RepID=UPI001D050B3A|nr:uncharacterized protein H6S33_007809 [Morchella sextelata]KAH0603487.1 hypothetical protein H6S33_007809 [Morchella sextelata]